MPDRAVVDDDYWTAPLPGQGPLRCPLCEAEMTPNIGGTWTCHKDHAPKPRAIVAISEDRKWLVVLPPNPDHGPAYWRFVRWVSGEDSYWEHDEYWRDDGQDAHEVLEGFLGDKRS